jgi:hypothetical protein
MSPLGNVPGPIGLGYPEMWPFLPAGLDRAEVGDIVYLTHEDINYALAVTYLNQILGWGDVSSFTGSLPYTAAVIGTHNKWIANDGSTQDPVALVTDCPATEKNCFTKCEASVTIAEVNNGKFPDVCGNTDMYGHGQNRTIYKEWLPDTVLNVIFPIGTVIEDTCGHQYTTKNEGYTGLTRKDTTVNNNVNWGKFNTNYGTCADTKMQVCTYADIGLGTTNTDSVNLWDHFRIYRSLWDIRE